MSGVWSLNTPRTAPFYHHQFPRLGSAFNHNHYRFPYVYHWLEEDSAPAPANNHRIRELYARDLANVPPLCKLLWKRYVDLWIDYARYEEFVAAGGDAVERTRQAYSQCLELIPHTKFSFVKAWLHANQFEIR
ncbi:hypothetical protein L3X38_032106 [Prunus dulcis]|uniref:Uncharacterized protein n=1 Tax=Prunus dulcis TaxID=3755 RepID=A0AAD4YVQ5_PRUDU|nr:hypothetical protein L3X38_032106 [Prunus dulcis]